MQYQILCIMEDIIWIIVDEDIHCCQVECIFEYISFKVIFLTPIIGNCTYLECNYTNDNVGYVHFKGEFIGSPLHKCKWAYKFEDLNEG